MNSQLTHTFPDWLDIAPIAERKPSKPAGYCCSGFVVSQSCEPTGEFRRFVHYDHGEGITWVVRVQLGNGG